MYMRLRWVASAEIRVPGYPVGNAFTKRIPGSLLWYHRLLSPAQPERTRREMVEILLIHLGGIGVIGR
jgi:hypothetical protein